MDPIHGYSVRESYRYIMHSGLTLDNNLADDIWHKFIPSKVSLMVRRLLRNRLLTKDNLLRWGVIHIDASTCVAGCGAPETALHLFLTCEISSGLWVEVRLWLGIYAVSPGDVRHHYQQFTKIAGMPRCSHTFLTIIWFATVWVLWKERNNRVFQNTVATPFTLIEKVKLNSFFWLKAMFASFSYSYHDWWKQPLSCMGIYV